MIKLFYDVIQFIFKGGYMSSLGSLSTHVQREQLLLRKLNDSLINIEANALGKKDAFGLSDEDVEQSKTTIHDFCNKLLAELSSESSYTDMQSLTSRIRSSSKPIDDWKDDLQNLISILSSDALLTDSHLGVLDDILSLLDVDFSEDLRRLYRL